MCWCVWCEMELVVVWYEIWCVDLYVVCDVLCIDVDVLGFVGVGYVCFDFGFVVC